MKKRIKSKQCANCEQALKKEENYCPQCGQENDQKIKSAPAFLKDFFEDVASIDTSFYRSVPLFLFRPGKLTNEYIAGRRKKYISPIRFYLTLSFFYFLVFSYQLPQNNDWDSEFQPNAQPETESSQNQVENSAEQVKNKVANKYNNASENELWGVNLNEVKRLSQQKMVNEYIIMDSLRIENNIKNWIIVRTALRSNTSKPSKILASFLSSLPVMMFLLLPVFAFVLRLLYVRKKKYYVEHLVFIFHLHSFFFLMFTLVLLLSNVLPDVDDELVLISILILGLYSYKSFRNVYAQGRFKTLLKLFLFYMLYPLILAVGVSFTLLWSILFL